MNEGRIKTVFMAHDADKEQIRRNVIESAAHQTEKARTPLRRPLLAACLSVLLVAVCLSGYAVAEAKEYKEAIDFFNEYELSTEGLTRAQIRVVYKDISTKTYSYEKTAELLNRTSVEMYDTPLGSLDRDSLEAFWNSRNTVMYGGAPVDKSGIWYDVCYTESAGADGNDAATDRVSIVKYDGQSELWRYTVPFGMYVFIDENVLVSDTGVLVYGSKLYSSVNSGRACAFMLDESGHLEWEYFSDDAGSEFEAAVVSDNETVLFGSVSTGGRVRDRLFTVLDVSGRMINTRTDECDSFVRCDTAVSIDDYYLVKQYVRTDGYSVAPELISVSRDGEPISKFTYSDDGNEYLIQDIAYRDGKVYLSALMQNIDEEKFDERFNTLCREFFEKWQSSANVGEGTVGIPDMPADYDERLHSLFTDAYSAVLLVCDKNATITSAYTSDGARAGTLTTDESGRLSWQVIRIDGVKNASPYISSRRVDILATEFSFVFDGDGKLIEKTEIGAFPLMY